MDSRSLKRPWHFSDISFTYSASWITPRQSDEISHSSSLGDGMFVPRLLVPSFIQTVVSMLITISGSVYQP